MLAQLPGQQMYQFLIVSCLYMCAVSSSVLARFLNDRPTNALSVSSVFPPERVFVFLRISLVLFI